LKRRKEENREGSKDAKEDGKGGKRNG